MRFFLVPRFFIRDIWRKRRSSTPLPPDDASLKKEWLQLRAQYFPDRPDLDLYTVTWSRRRQKRVLACCSLERRHVRVAQELQREDLAKWIPPLLHHEMCHAVLGKSVKGKKGRYAWHGREFRKLEALHPDIPLLDAWIKSGGFSHAVRSHRARSQHARRRSKRT